METAKKPHKKYRTGCLIPLGLYLAVLVIGFITTRPPLITENLDDEPTSSRFSIATVEDGESGYEYGRRTLQTLSATRSGFPERRFLLPEPEITIYVGDIHHARIIEDHGDWQLIEFNYSNTYMATSIYRAYADRIEPVSYQVNSSIADAFVAMLFTAFSVALYLLVALINFVWTRWVRRDEDIKLPEE